MLQKIVILGPESTGKSTLCEQLAQHYRTSWCPEFAREYLLTNGKEYTFDDLSVIARGQMALEAEYTQQLEHQWKELTVTDQPNRWVNAATMQSQPYPPVLFIDTDMYVMKVWCEYVFGKCHSFILDEIATRSYDLYLLCKPDLPWVQDELREYPDEQPRQELYHIYRDIMINQSVPWIEISGDYEERMETAIKAIDQHLQKIN
jgi:NadR type nicotinamide-nucleotide adenylyltransferase